MSKAVRQLVTGVQENDFNKANRGFRESLNAKIKARIAERRKVVAEQRFGK